jgi:hypothetical protein
MLRATYFPVEGMVVQGPLKVNSLTARTVVKMAKLIFVQNL